MLANKSHLLHSITVNYTQLEPFIAHPLLTLPGLINPFTALCLSRFQARRRSQRGCRNFRRRGGSVGAAENRECKFSSSDCPRCGRYKPGGTPAVRPLFLPPVNGVWKMELCLDSSGLMQLVAGPLCSSQGLSAPPTFTALVLECSPGL